MARTVRKHAKPRIGIAPTELGDVVIESVTPNHNGKVLIDYRRSTDGKVGTTGLNRPSEEASNFGPSFCRTIIDAMEDNSNYVTKDNKRYYELQEPYTVAIPLTVGAENFGVLAKAAKGLRTETNYATPVKKHVSNTHGRKG